jgi:uncharacterized protein
VNAFVQRHPLAAYFGMVFLISWGSGLIALVPKMIRGETIPSMSALLLFPVLVLGVALTSIILTWVQDGKAGVQHLFARIGVWRVHPQWYAVVLLTPPVLILITLLSLYAFVSQDFSPNFFPLGLLFGIFPGFFEEIGWMGYAFPKIQSNYSALTAGILLGMLWGLWHLPVVDSLGAAAPHRAYWLPFFLAFIAVVAAIRVLIVWVYSNTQSLLLAQLMHASSTGSLVILSPAHVVPSQETLWYAVYAAVLWIAVALVVKAFGSHLMRQLPPVKVIKR